MRYAFLRVLAGRETFHHGLLALQDIFHGYEPDLSLEWWVVSCALLVSVAFHVVSLVALKRPV